MRPLHVRLIVADAQREDVAALSDALRAAGHVVMTRDADAPPPGIAVAADFVVTDGMATPTPESLERAEARHIAAVLDFVGGNRRQAALLLGIARSTLLAKLRKFRLE